MIYAFDFDGTLCEDAYPEIGEPNMLMINYVKYLKSQGHSIILWTCRTNTYLAKAVKWCATFGITFNAVNKNVAQNIAEYGTDCRKVYADYYIDDKCIPINHHTIINNNVVNNLINTIAGDYISVKTIIIKHFNYESFKQFETLYNITKFPDLTFAEQKELFSEISLLFSSTCL